METINVLIVDDIKDDAELLNEAFGNRNIGENRVITYITTVISGTSCYPEALDYIDRNYRYIDIVCSDFGLGEKGNGIMLFEYFKKYRRRPFRILHSLSHIKLLPNRELIHQDKYDVHCKTKSDYELKFILEQYETEILPVKKFGNPKFRCIYDEHNIPKWNDDINIKERDLFYNLVKFKRIERKIFITCRYPKHSPESIFDEEYNLTLKSIVQDNNKLFPYIQLSKSILINQLWISKIDRHSNQITVITPDSYISKIHYSNWDAKLMYSKNYKELEELPIGLHAHFTKG